MTRDQENQIRVRAHEIWVDAGMPEGKADEHWAQAEAEIRARITPSPATTAKTRASAKAPVLAANPVSAKPASARPAKRKPRTATLAS